jgi:hypothetical protein
MMMMKQAITTCRKILNHAVATSMHNKIWEILNGTPRVHYAVGNFDNFSLYLFSYNVARYLVEECHANTDMIDDNAYNVLCFLGTYALYLADLDTIYMFVNKHCLNIIIRVSQMNNFKSRNN